MNYSDIRALFDRVVALNTTERRALLDRESVDPAVRAEVEALLAAAVTADNIGERIERAAVSAVTAALPERIGPYRIGRLLGEGGMGTVLLGERDDGEFEMQVAIKLIRGYVSDSARERFRRERQMLATLDHPNIANLIDGGTTPAGEPYLVMPYVEGETLGSWLARTQPPLNTRLRLFLALCHAVHFAHAHLVVHCDLKPGNVLVRNDGTPVLLDFGIARMLDPQMQDRARTATRLLTPRYASPEQLLGRPTTTATDVYGLGLLLYELLAGDVPERGDAERAASTELPPPSRLAATSPVWRGDARRIRGDLDKIVRRAVRTEPASRYPSALALAADVEAFLDGRPVQAAGRHWLYVFGKFVRRNRYAVMAGVASVIALIAFALELRAERDRAREAETRATREAEAANAITDFLVGVFAELDPNEHPGRQLTGRELLDLGRTRLETIPTSRADLRARLQDSLGFIYTAAGQPVPAIALLEPAVAELNRSGTPRARVRAMNTLARAYNGAKNFEPALKYATAAEELATRELPDDPDTIAHAAMARGVAEQSLMMTSQAEASFARAKALFTRAGSTADLAAVMHNLGWIEESRGNWAKALEWLERAVAEKSKVYPQDHPQVLTSQFNRAKMLAQLGRHAEAAAAFEEHMARNIRVYGPKSRWVADDLNELASINQDLGNYVASQDYYERSMALDRWLTGGEDDLSVATAQNNIGTLLEERGDIVGAEKAFRGSLATREKVLPAGHMTIATPAHNLARAFLAAGRVDEAEPLLEKALTLRRASMPAEHPLRVLTELLTIQRDLAHGDLTSAEATLAAQDEQLAKIPSEGTIRLRVVAADARARVAAARGDMAARRDAAAEAYRLAATDLPADHPKLAQFGLALAEAELAAGDREAARQRALAIAPVLRAELVQEATALQRLAALEKALGLPATPARPPRVARPG